ncbi:MAG: hypothetical protein PHG65_00135 [Kiritimatiellae bacterium]|nr:hypothetical protein [Kiritimatiellia bacterium]
MKRMILRRLGIALILFLALLFLLAPPFKSDRLIGVQPNDAVFFSIHRNPAARLPQLIGNPLTGALIVSAGLDPSSIDVWIKKPGNNRLAAWLFSGECTLACHTSLKSDTPDVWSFTDHLGWKTTLTRLWLRLLPIPYVERWGTYKTYDVYRLHAPDLPRNLSFTFSVVDEGIIGCIAPGIRPIHAMLDRYIARSSGLLSVYQQLNRDSETARSPDSGWAQTASTPCLFSFQTISSNSIHGMCRWETPTDAPPPPEHAITLSDAANQLLAGNSLGILSATPDYAIRLFQPLFPLTAHPFLQRITTIFSPQQAFAALLNEKYEARFMRMKFPALIIGISLPDNAKPEAMLNQYLDELNARFRLGLILEKISITDSSAIYAIEGTSGNAYSRMPNEERIVCAVTKNLLLVSNSQEALTNLVQQCPPPDAEDGAPNPFTQQAETLNRTLARLRFDLDHGGKALRLALTAYGLKRLQEAPDESLHLRQGINEAKAWIDALGALQELRVECLIEAEGKLAYHFHFGH